ncbi:MAG: Enzyme that catalyzes the fourth step in the histidine pathway [Bathelium mastoideum]|nr:MAG: Enzyme that catalyzes the fourth step in the histidine pathway [Bathelium mastoideum]
MTIFRPCIDLHAGQVKQIVGSSLRISAPELPSPNLQSIQDLPPATTTTSTNPSSPPDSVVAPHTPTQAQVLASPSQKRPSAEHVLKENYVSSLPASYYARLYRDHELRGGHVIQLGPGNEDAAREALMTWPGGLQVGGGVTDRNARMWIEAGAEKVIVTSFLFPSARFSLERLQAILSAIGGDRQKLVVDVSCKTQDGKWIVAMDKWTRLTDMEVNEESVHLLAPYCSELLVHAADHEGLQAGIDHALVAHLSRWTSSLPAQHAVAVTYAGGGRSIADLETVQRLSGGRVDLTIGSALDIFGGRGVCFEDCVEWNRRQEAINPH